jgi:hypothetical protein
VSTNAGSSRVAFKEWAGVCDALIQGRQAVILRKGGISEATGAGGFVPEHSEFWLYPTWLHQAEQGLRSHEGPAVHVPAADGSIPIRALVRVESTAYIDRESALDSLAGFHMLTDETIRKRFHYRRPGLWVLAARVWASVPGFTLRPTLEQAGCKTWVFLDEPLPTSGLVPVLDDDEWAKHRESLQSATDLASEPSPRFSGPARPNGKMEQG